MTGPTVLTPAKRFFQPGVTKVLMVPTIASTELAATLTELDAGTDFTGDINDVTGFTVTSNDIQVPSYGGRFVPSIQGTITADTSQITVYADADGADATSVFTQDQSTYIAFLWDGFNASSIMDVYSVRVSSVSRTKSISDAATVVLTFTITQYAEGLDVPSS